MIIIMNHYFDMPALGPYLNYIGMRGVKGCGF